MLDKTLTATGSTTATDWLRSVVPYFERPEIGFVQSPQDHRDWRGNPFKEMINWEYAGFFRIGMVHRNERDAIIEHGTMTLIRKKAMDQVGHWSEWCICEDAEMGLRLMEAGWQSAYCTEVFGRGLVPDSFAGYKRQRHRWAYGAVQIVNELKHTGGTAGFFNTTPAAQQSIPAATWNGYTDAQKIAHLQSVLAAYGLHKLT